MPAMVLYPGTYCTEEYNSSTTPTPGPEALYVDFPAYVKARNSQTLFNLYHSLMTAYVKFRSKPIFCVNIKKIYENVLECLSNIFEHTLTPYHACHKI